MRLRTLRPAVALAAALTAVPAVATAAPGPVAATPPSSPSSCGVSTPPVVVSSGAVARTTARLSSSCPLGSSATWRLVGPNGRQVSKVSISGSRAVTVSIPTRSAATFGNYRLVPVSGTDTDYGLMIVTPGSVAVKAGSRLAAKDSGRTTTVVATRWDAATRKQVAWSRARVTLQRRTCTGTTCTWSIAGTTRTDSRGRATLPRPAGNAGSFRVVTAASATVGGRTVVLGGH
ncbi:hypothetical protein [Mobilicoccus pelagius]|uniref:Uncharacterized protein n=1 Tax=Mobilicoccus pelagius NBRC 104925 TaxID=1089455 RepID=H5UMU7_9MICO|nr:hypothetical protein [Mobilicoccus pelagius]GAB47055.1 hypothetical protein MOPEL_003_00790 [Mobilicoccus pelagius NBRC 104925]